MAGVSDPFQDPTSHNGTNEQEKLSDNLLLQKLLEQNRLLEEDHKFLTHSNSLQGSTCSDSTSIHSTDSLSSLRSPNTSHDNPPHLSPPLHTPSADSPLLHSPTEVRRKPLLLTSYEDRDSDNEGLGPNASILLDDGFETRIEYSEVVSPEVGTSNYGEMATADNDSDPSDLTTTIRGLKKSTITSSSDITLMFDEGNKERLNNNHTSVLAPGPYYHANLETRYRSDTETAASRRISLSTIVGSKNRARALTEGGGGTIREEVESKEQEEEPPQRTAEEELWHKWSELLRNFKESMKKKLPLIKQLARQGIPDPIRGMAWQLLSGSQDPELKEQYPALIIAESPFVRAIQRDLNRTFPEHSFFKESDGLGQEGLLNILKAYSIYDREVGYCQGSPFITGLLLMKMPEEEAFCVFVKLMKDYRMREVFKPSMSDLGLCFYILEKFLEELFPDLYIHFKAVGFQTSMYASPWFLTMFASVLSLNVVFRIVDIFLLEGREIIFRVGLALIEHNRETLLRGDLEDILKYFQKGMKSEHENDPDALIQRALKIRLSHKKLKKLEKEYITRKEKEALEGKEISRLQTENTNLAQRISALEKECASLADKLIQRQVTLAENAEEKFILKKKLSIAERKLASLEKTKLPSVGSADSAIVEHEGVIEVEEVGATGSECIKEEESGLPSDEQFLPLKTSLHVCREEAEQVLRQLGVGTPGTSPLVSRTTISPPSQSLPVATSMEEANDEDSPCIAGEIPRDSPSTGEIPLGTSPNDSELQEAASTKGKKSKLKKLTHRFSHKSDGDARQKYKKTKDGDSKQSVDDTILSLKGVESLGQSPAPSPTTHTRTLGRKKSKSLSGDITLELAKVKLQCAETAHELEEKSLELSKALHREEFVVDELKSARKLIMRLEQRLSELKSCPQCGHGLQTDNNLNFDLTDFPLNLSPIENADSSNIPQVIGTKEVAVNEANHTS